MSCCQCEAIERNFDRKSVAKELKRYREKGPEKATRILIEALKTEGIEGVTLLDIGGGVGAIQHALLAAGASRAINVDAATAYIEAAKEEAERRGLSDRISHHRGNFVDLAPSIEEADIVTLDKVICCYHDVQALVGLSSARAHKLYGLVYPRDAWWMKIVFRTLNFLDWLRRNPFRAFLHPTHAVDALVNGRGLQRRFRRNTVLWQVVIYSR